MTSTIELTESEVDELIDQLEYPDDDAVEPVQYSITSYGADFVVDGLVSRIRKGDIEIPSFQRDYVWSATQGSRFIESLLLGLPIPGIFLCTEDETNKLLVIDGQQRLLTLKYFYDGAFQNDPKRPFILKNVQKQLIGLTYKTLSDADRRRLDNSVIHATVVSQDKPSEDKSSIYHIFERLNTGGTPLQAQEIRSALYHGGFNDLLERLNQDKSWRAVFGAMSPRMKDQELILRFIALFYEGDKYKAPMLGFLNKFMSRNRDFKLYKDEDIARIFGNSISTIHRNLGNRIFRPKRALNAAVFDSVMVGVARNLESKTLCDENQFRERYDALLRDNEYIVATETGTSQETNVANRLKLATTAFARK